MGKVGAKENGKSKGFELPLLFLDPCMFLLPFKATSVAVECCVSFESSRIEHG